MRAMLLPETYFFFPLQHWFTPHDVPPERLNTKLLMLRGAKESFANLKSKLKILLCDFSSMLSLW